MRQALNERGKLIAQCAGALVDLATNEAANSARQLVPACVPLTTCDANILVLRRGVK